jgi:hypothetical protein
MTGTLILNNFRFTDVCDFCEYGRELLIKLLDMASFYEFYIDLSQDLLDQKKSVDNFLNYIKNLKDQEIDKNIRKNLIDMTMQYQSILYHKKIAQLQRNSYNSQRKNENNFLKDKILIELDFKQKIVIGSGPRQKSEDYYKQEVKTLLGFGIYHQNSKNETECINFDVVTGWDQSALTVVELFKVLRKQDFFKKIVIKTYVIWADCGKHFQNKEFLYYLFFELASEGIKVELNFFCEKHGKNA